MPDRLVSVDTADYRLPQPVLDAAVLSDENDEAIAGFLSSATPSAAQTAADGRYGTTLYAPAYGVVGNGVADDAPALQVLLNKAATVGASVTLRANSTLRIAASLTVPTGTRLLGNGATIVKATSLAAIAFIISDRDNILIENLRLDGTRAAFASSEHQHGFYIVNGSENITLRDVEVFNCNGDGIYVGDQAAPAKNITLINCDSRGNNRQAMSVSHVSGLDATNCRFTGTTGTNPRAGVDIEPNSDAVVCEDITFTGCTFSGNGHFGFLVSLRAAPTARQGGVHLIGCVISGNGVDSASFGGGVNLRAARDFSMIGGAIRNNVGPGVRVDWTTISTGIKFIGVMIESNTQHGIQVTSGFDDFTVSDCTIRGNGTGSSGSYPGALFNPTLASTNLRFIGNTSEGATQRYGFQTTATVTRVMLVGNTYRDNATGPRALADEATSRLDLESVVKPVVTGSRGGNAALASLLTAQAARGLITDNTTA